MKAADKTLRSFLEQVGLYDPEATRPLIDDHQREDFFISNPSSFDSRLEELYGTTTSKQSKFTEHTNLVVPTEAALKLMLAITYFFTLFGLCYAIFEDPVRLEDVAFEGTSSTRIEFPPLPPQQLNITVPRNETHSWWRSSLISFKPIDLYLWFFLQISRSSNADLGLDRVSEAVSGYVLLDISQELNGQLQNSSFSKTLDFMLSCQANKLDCETVPIFEPYGDDFGAQWQDRMADQFHSGATMNITVVYLHRDMRSPTNIMTYVLTRSNTIYKFVEIGFRGFFAILSSFFLLYWLYRLWKYGWSTALPEQRWMIILFLGLVLYLDPAAGTVITGKVNRLITAVTFTTCTVLFMLFWLLMMEGVHQFKRDISSFGCRFYALKVSWAIVSWSSSVIYILMSELDASVELQSQPDLQIDISWRREVIVLIPFVVWCISLVCWVFWFVRETLRTSKHLKKLPYLPYRARQLCFRFFKSQTAVILIYLIVFEAIWFIKGASIPSILDSYNTHLGTVFVFSIYVFQIAYLYLPSTPRTVKEELGDFSLPLARFLCDVSWQSYLQAPEGFSVSRGSDDWGLMDPAQVSQRLIAVEDCPEFDVRVIMTRGKKQRRSRFHKDPCASKYDITIAFRGTKSLKNVASDLKFQRISVPGSYWFGDESEHQYDHLRGFGETHIDTLTGTSTTPTTGEHSTDGSSIRKFSEIPDSPQHGEHEGRASRVRRTFKSMFDYKRVIDFKMDFGFSSNSGWGFPDTKIHKGFWMAYLSVRSKIFRRIERLLDSARQSGANLRFYVTGHSLGAALATICALEMRIRYRIQPTLYTFGSPRVGNHAFARAHTRLVKDSFRIICNQDIVASIPKFVRAFKHVGVEIVIDEHGNVIREPSWVEKQLLPPKSSFQDHQLAKYRTGLEEGCVLSGFPHKLVYQPVFQEGYVPPEDFKSSFGGGSETDKDLTKQENRRSPLLFDNKDFVEVFNPPEAIVRPCIPRDSISDTSSSISETRVFMRTVDPHSKDSGVESASGKRNKGSMLETKMYDGGAETRGGVETRGGAETRGGVKVRGGVGESDVLKISYHGLDVHARSGSVGKKKKSRKKRLGASRRTDSPKQSARQSSLRKPVTSSPRAKSREKRGVNMELLR